MKKSVLDLYKLWKAEELNEKQITTTTKTVTTNNNENGKPSNDFNTGMQHHRNCELQIFDFV